MAEVAGAPVAPCPGPLPTYQLRFGNDFLGIFDRNVDDHRTFQASTSLRFGAKEAFVAVLDYSSFTDRGPQRWETDDPEEEGRIDQGTATIGRVWDGHEDAVASWVAVGVGLRATADLGGQDIQDRVHDLTGGQRLDLPVEETRAYEGVGYLAGGWMFTQQARDFVREIGVHVPVSALVGSSGVVETSMAADGFLRRGFLTAWTGLRFEGRWGHDVDPTVDHAMDVEHGWYWHLGLSTGALVIDLGRHLEDDHGYGWMTFRSVPGEMTSDPLPPDQNRVWLEASVQPDAFGYGAKVIVQPTFLSDLAIPGRLGFAIGMMEGNAPRPEVAEAWPRQEQITAGFDWEYSAHDRVAIGLGIRAGERSERLELSDAAQGLRSTEASSTTLAGDLTLRINLGYLRGVEELVARRTAFGLAFGFAWWHPLKQHARTLRGNEFELLQPSITPLLALRVGTAW